MAILNQKRILNLIPKTSAPVTIHVSQGDVGTEIEFTLVKGDELFVNTGSLSASVHGVREDGANFGAFTCILSGSSVKFPLHSEMTMVKGSAIAEIVLVDSQGNKVGSANFGIMVEESVFPLGVTYDNDVSIYESILAYVQTIPAQVTQDYNTKINAETAARQAADSSLNEALTNEANARAAADTALGARIDNIVAPSGEAPSAAEVTDARVGVNGNAYSSLGGSVRGQIKDTNKKIEEISITTTNLFDFSSIVIGRNQSGMSIAARASSGAMYCDSAVVTVKALNLPNNLKYGVYFYSTSDISSVINGFPNDWVTDNSVVSSEGLQSTYKYFRVVFASVNNQALTPNDFDGLKMQVNNGSTLLQYEDHLEGYDRTSRQMINSLKNNEIDTISREINTISKETDNLFNPLNVELNKKGDGVSGYPARAISDAMYTVGTDLVVKAINLPSNLQYNIAFYETDNASSYQQSCFDGWITDNSTKEVVNKQSTYHYWRVIFASRNNAALTSSDFEGLVMQINDGAMLYNYIPFLTACDWELRNQPIKLRIMEYNIGHYCYGQGTSFDDVGLPADIYDEKVEGMKEFFAKYQPDILGLCEYWEYLDNAKTHMSDDVLFDPIFPYKHQTTQWNAIKSNYELLYNKKVALGGTGQLALKSLASINGKEVAILLIHFGLTAESAILEMTNALNEMRNYENVIIMGDFNSDPISTRTAIFNLALADGYTLANGGYWGWKNTWSYNNPDRAIDNILVKGNIKIKDFQVLTTEVDELCSDHIPIYTDIVIY